MTWALDDVEALARELGRNGHSPTWVIAVTTARSIDRGVKLPEWYVRRLLRRAAERGALYSGVPT